MSALLFWVTAVAAAVGCGCLFVEAWREPNEGRFWDDNNPSGFHRFVPPLYAAAVAAVGLAMLHSFDMIGR